MAGKVSAPEPVQRPVGRPSSRPLLLDAALTIVAEHGVGALTFEALAQAAGASKGGLLYHFPTKEALLEALTDRLIERYSDARCDAVDRLPDTPSRELKGYAIASLHNRSQLDTVSARLKLSGVWNSKASREYYASRFELMSRGVGFDRAALVHLATEGLWFMELADLSPFTGEDRTRIVSLLLRLADGGEIPPDETPEAPADCRARDDAS